MRPLQSLFALILLCVAGTAPGQATWDTPNETVTGEELFAACTLCHGTLGQGSMRRDSPALAGLEPWYLELQMNNFKRGLRGYMYEDIPGQAMFYASTMLRDDATIKSLASYISSLEAGLAPDENTISERPYIWDSPFAGLDPKISANAEAGERTYTTVCVVCHAEDGTGNEALGAANLTYLSDTYMIRQLQYFREGIRGAHPEDIRGQQMAAMAKTLTDDQSIADVVAYISGLR